ncbi:catechol 2,3-dioxygenase-like lactoylglutathione lyase family enzyme [Actinocorallia herbida]|uniref:Catechol 2,3-dioxygenase-like lactoylglutathione lyase family enzyme n=2 Tax=Actinocorallia herbida TaxID=58109 RepID=A0A3N1CYY4_9ACTN|nr:catechol 2,3-dioxygenase-like lactoylglutathione lyase family enzyme [Actinocorallia herbida]
MNWTLEVVIVPVSDVARAKEFYAGRLGWHIDHETPLPDGRLMLQLTPPGSGCSIVIAQGLTDMPPGALQGLQLVVNDLRAAHAELLGNGVETSDIVVLGPHGQRPSDLGDDLDNVGFLFFTDPDGNAWAVQQITARA